jgi:predicted secreted protein
MTDTRRISIRLTASDGAKLDKLVAQMNGKLPAGTITASLVIRELIAADYEAKKRKGQIK